MEKKEKIGLWFFWPQKGTRDAKRWWLRGAGLGDLRVGLLVDVAALAWSG